MQFHSIAITGAGAGLGQALALALAGPGQHLFLCARSVDRLANVAESCRAKGATVDAAQVDVRDAGQVVAWLDRIDAVRPLDLVIANAGVFSGRAADAVVEQAEMAANVVATNLAGAVTLATHGAQLMAPRGTGRIALISSLAAFFPHADAAAYSASKAGLTAYGAALDEAVSASGLGVSVIHPGHIETAQTTLQHGALPLMISPGAAAARILRGLEAGRRRMSFPIALRLLLALHRALPRPLRYAVNRPFRFHVGPPGD